MPRPRLLSVLALALMTATAVSAQGTTLDEGSFTITRGGERAGREDFSIKSTASPAGPVLLAHAVVALGGRRIEPVVKADSGGSVLEYQTEIREGGRTSVKYSGALARDHYRARISRAEGESQREFRLPPGTVVSEDDVLHQLWFIARRGPGAAVSVLAPLRNVVETVRVELVGNEQLMIETRDVASRHLRLRTEGSGVTRDVWVDDAGRLLKVVIPATKIVAVRDEPPR